MFAASKTSAGATTPPAPTTDPYFDYVTMLLHGDGNSGGQNQTFIDSTSNFPITVTGTPTQGTFSPYNDSGYSVYFDGNGDYLTTGTLPALGTADFTFECWVYANDWGSSSQGVLFGNTFTTGNFQVYIERATSSFKWQLYTQGISTSPAFTLNQWNHIAIVRSGTNVLSFLNGTLVNTTTGITNSVSSSTFTIGSRGAALYLPGYISNLRLTPGIALYSSNFTPSVTPLNTTANTSLLVCASQRFEDLSGANTTITKSGDAAISQFSPYKNYTKQPVSYSNWFSGSNQYLTVSSNSNFNFGSGNYTIESWFYATSVATQTTIVEKRSGSAFEWILFLNGAQVQWFPGFDQTSNILSATSVNVNSWNHVACVRNGNTFTLYLNGVSVGTLTSSLAIPFGSMPINIGYDLSVSARFYFSGAISNLRIVKGTAVYTSNFTPPTSPLTNTGDTLLLTCKDYIFFDNSSYANAVTATGAQPVKGNPFGYTSTATTGYSTLTNAGSAYFDGATGGLNFKDYFGVNGYNFAGNFQFEAWVYPTANDASGSSMLFASIGQDTYVQYNASTGSVAFTVSGVAVIAATGTGVKIGMWNHIMVNRSGTTCRLFVNGLFINTGTSSATVNISSLGYYAKSGSGYEINGYATGFLLYDYNPSILGPIITQAFQPLTTVPSYATGQVFNLKMANGQIIDNAQQNDLLTVGNAQVNTSIKKYGTGSIAFDGSGDSLFAANQSSILMSGGNFTIEAWVNPNSFGSTYNPIIANAISNVSTAADLQYFLYLDGSGKPTFKAYSASTAYTVASASAIPTGSWTFIAAVRNGSTLTLYVNGVSVATTTIGTVILNGSTLALIRCGAYQEASVFYYLNGYVDDLRVTKGIARYTANFTPPSAAFPNYS